MPSQHKHAVEPLYGDVLLLYILYILSLHVMQEFYCNIVCALHSFNQDHLLRVAHFHACAYAVMPGPSVHAYRQPDGPAHRLHVVKGTCVCAPLAGNCEDHCTYCRSCTQVQHMPTANRPHAITFTAVTVKTVFPLIWSHFCFVRSLEWTAAAQC